MRLPLIFTFYIMIYKLNIQRLFTILLLGFLSTSAFFIRLNNFQRTNMMLTIDEIVYYRMAEQVSVNFFDYNTIPYGKELADRGRDLPSYFFAPLFKHPPVFTYLTSFSIRLFGVNLISAAYVPLFMGAMMIPLIYLMGTLIANRLVGLLAAVFLWLDPVSIICSQKIWMDTPLAFFILLSSLFFVYALNKNQDLFFLLSGIAGGFAVNTKYPGILVIMAIFLFSLFYRKDLFLRPKFWMGLCLPILMTLPWFFWNFQVYGLASLKEHSEFSKFLRILTQNAIIFVPVVLAIVLSVFFLLKKSRKVIKHNDPELKLSVADNDPNLILNYSSLLITGAFIFFYLKDSIFRTFDPNFLPATTWRQGIFYHETPTFYFRKLIEFFGIYILSFIALFIYHPKEKSEAAFVRISGSLIMLFFMFWGNFQSRYVLSSIPFFLLMAAGLIQRILNFIDDVEAFIPRIVFKSLLILFLGLCLMKVFYLNSALSFTNDMCYF